MSAKFKIEKGSSSQNDKPTCVKCGKKHYGECPLGTGSCFGCGKDGYKVKDCPNRDGKKAAPSVPKEDAPTRRRSYALRSRGLKPDESDDDVDKSYCSCCNLISF